LIIPRGGIEPVGKQFLQGGEVSCMHKHIVSDVAKGITPSSIRKIFNLSKSMTDVISFGIGEPDFNTPKYITDAARKAMDDGYTHYTVNAGLPELRECISEKLSHENRITADPKETS